MSSVVICSSKFSTDTKLAFNGIACSQFSSPLLRRSHPLFEHFIRHICVPTRLGFSQNSLQ